jgi:putative transposase
VSRFIDEQRGRFGVEPSCRTVGVSASAYYQRATGDRSARSIEDERLLERIRALHAANYHAYGYRRAWKGLRREGVRVGHDRVKRLMRAHAIQGAKRRGKPWETTKADPRAQRRPDLVQRDFSAAAPNRLWVADLSYLRCWVGLVFLAFGARRLQPPRGGLAARRAHAYHARARRAQDGALATRPGRRRRARASPRGCPSFCV